MRTSRFLWAKKSKSIHTSYATFAATASWVNCLRFEGPDPEVVARRLSPNYAACVKRCCKLSFTRPTQAGLQSATSQSAKYKLTPQNLPETVSTTSCFAAASSCSLLALVVFRVGDVARQMPCGQKCDRRRLVHRAELSRPTDAAQ